MKKLLFFICVAGSLAFSAPPPTSQAPGKGNRITPDVIINKAPDGWNSETILYSLRCPAPSDWTDKNGWMVILLKKGEILTCCLETPAGRVNDILIDDARQLAVVSIQISRGEAMIYVVRWKEGKVWAVDQKPFDHVLDEHRPKEDPENHYALSSFQLVGLHLKGNTVEGLVRHRSGLNPMEHGLSMLIRFSIDLDAPQPAAGALWPLTVTIVDDSAQEREWNPGNRDFNPPLLPSKQK